VYKLAKRKRGKQNITRIGESENERQLLVGKERPVLLIRVERVSNRWGI
jgi:hypothetical protein